MRSSVYLALLLSLTLTACTNKPAGSENANPDATKYASLKDQDDWNDFLRERERDVNDTCRDGSYSYSSIEGCATESVSLASLTKRHQAWKRYVAALKAASLSGKFNKSQIRRLDSRAEDAEKQNEYFAKGFKHNSDRRARQDKILVQLNQTSCKAVRNEHGDTEISLTDCDPTKASDAVKIASLLEQLMNNSAANDRTRLQVSYERFNTVSPKYAELARIKQSLLDRGVITITGSIVGINGAGHPFGGTADLQDLAAYSKVAKEIATALGSADLCSSPCERNLYDLSAALNASYMGSYCSTNSGGYYGNAPNVDYLQTWYNMNNMAHLSALGITFGTAGKDFSSEVHSEYILNFPRLFSSENISLSISNWRRDSVCPEAAPLYYIFQETEALIAFLKKIGSNSASQVREIRFVSNSSSISVRAVKTGDGYIRLEIPTVERVTAGKSVASVRDEIYRKLPDALAEAR